MLVSLYQIFRHGASFYSRLILRSAVRLKDFDFANIPFIVFAVIFAVNRFLLSYKNVKLRDD